MTAEEIKKRFPNASPGFIKANLQIDYRRSAPVMERDSGNATLAEDQSKEGAARKLAIRFVSVRKRLLDPDKLSVKWLLDACRYARIIRGDEPEKITLEVTQRKCAKGEREHTIIEIVQTTQP